MCSFEQDVEILELSKCNLFRRSFSNKGMGFTFNNEKEGKLLQEDFWNHPFFPNQEKDPSLMKSATIEDSLRVVVENNAEEIEKVLTKYFKIQNATSAMLRILIPVNRPSIPPETYEYGILCNKTFTGKWSKRKSMDILIIKRFIYLFNFIG